MQVVSYTQYYKTFLPAVTIVRRWFTEWRQDPTADKMLSLSLSLLLNLMTDGLAWLPIQAPVGIVVVSFFLIFFLVTMKWWCKIVVPDEYIMRHVFAITLTCFCGYTFLAFS